jgi:hypothetical protein
VARVTHVPCIANTLERAMEMDVAGLVDTRAGLISCRIFIEPEIYKQELANRKLILDQNVLLAKNVSIFF